MTQWLAPHDHDHGHGHDRLHAVDAHEDEHQFWLGAGEAYAGLRTSLQLLAGLQLLGVRRDDRADLRRAVLIKVGILLAEVHERLNAISAPDSVRPHLAELAACREGLRMIARRQGAELARDDESHSARQTRQMLRQATDRLRRCQRYDLGLRFYGSGGCADAEHALSHLRAEGAPYA